jgi:hypothetical protein
MKRLMIYTGLLIMMGFGLTGCYKDVILPDAAVDPDAPAQPVSFKTDIAPFVATHWFGRMPCFRRPQTLHDFTGIV